MQAAVYAVLMLASLIPSKGWFAPDQPLVVDVRAEGEQMLLLTDFNGRVLESKAPTVVAGEKMVNVRDLYVQLATAGTYVLYLTKVDGTVADFTGTPLVISIREDRRRGAPTGPSAIRVEPLRYGVMRTAHGPATIAFYYDAAPNTVAAFQSLAENGFYDGLTFHRVVPEFVIQGGDPAGNGTGGPGYSVREAPPSDQAYTAGVVAMAKAGDEPPGTSGSQFFVVTGDDTGLPPEYAVAGEVTEGMDVVDAIEALGTGDGPPSQPVVIESAKLGTGS